MSEVRALLLTDVVDSAKLSETLGDAEMAALWVAHDRVARDLLPTWRGREIDKTDGMLLLFDTASDAAAYAMAYHRALGRLSTPLKARVGLHVGPVILRENSRADVARGAKPLEVEGTAKPMTARVMSIAHGGQTLLSSDARKALGEFVLRVESHGHWRMKGFAEPIELFEIGDAEAPFVPPDDAAKAYRVVREGDAWLPARDIRHSLPAERDSFVGRRDTLLDLARRLDAGARLVSVLGIGGTGKTRLVIRFGWSWLGDFAGGVWFCDLSQARSLDGVVHAAAQGLDVLLGNDDPVIQLGNAIAGRGHCLVILDNFEQVARFAEETLGRWLNRASNAQFVVTTREVLGLQGEEVLAVAPLNASDAMALFLRRAGAAKPDFQANAEDRAAITRLLALLDCLPLAIELAAARVRVMPPRTLLARMSDRFNLLSSTGRRQDRQATLRAVFDWSWDLLPTPEKAALAQLSVFEGGFTLESVEAVLDLSAYDDAPLPMDALQSLLQKSFVRQVAEARFDLLMSVKEYASEHLRTEGRYGGSGQSALYSAEARHGAYFSGLSERLAAIGKGIELDNFVAACRRAVLRRDAEVAANALERAWGLLRMRGPFATGVELASVVRDTPGIGPASVALVEWIAGAALSDCGRDLDAVPRFEASLVGAREIGDRRQECRALIGLGLLDIHAGRFDSSRARLDAALVIALEIEDPVLLSDVHNRLGTVDWSVENRRDARSHYETAVGFAREAGDRHREGSMLGNLAGLHFDEGNLDESLSGWEAALAAAREMGDRRLEANTLGNLGLLYEGQDRFAAALDQLNAALVVARDLGHSGLECNVLDNLGRVYIGLARFDEASDHLEAALANARGRGDQHSEALVMTDLGLLSARQARFSDARRCLDAGELLLRAVSDQTSLGVLLCVRAETENLAGSLDTARAALAEAETIAGAIEAAPSSELGRAITRVHRLLVRSSTA
jgi:predicted ATPase/class 3 adenylate cyclase